MDLKKPEYYINRELSWLKFNLRVLREAGVRTLPLLERLRFVAISASNLDEFFMVRVAGLVGREESGIERPDIAGLSTREQLTAIAAAAHSEMKLKYRYFFALVKELEKYAISFSRVEDLSGKARESLERYYKEMVFPVLTPMAIDASRPFPFLANKSLNIALELRDAKDIRKIAFIQVPSVLPRVIPVKGAGDEKSFVFLEDLIMAHCGELFKGLSVLDAVPFRITRDSDLEVDEDETHDLMKEIERSLKKRKRGSAVRLEINPEKGSFLQDFLKQELDLVDEEIYEVRGPLDLTFLFGFISQKGMESLCFKPYTPQVPAELTPDLSLFDQIRDHDILLHHPYESFDPVVNLIRDAAEDPKVLAIKQTLYRVSGNSPIVAALAKAAENGKQVTALVELKARFDEENNLATAEMMQAAGIKIIYSIPGLKVHAKVALVRRRGLNGEKIPSYAYISTGNFNEKTATLYADCGLFTCRKEIVNDLYNLFRTLQGKEDPKFTTLLVARFNLIPELNRLIDHEIELAKSGKQGRIILKMNALQDPTMIDRLYEASQAGVRIDLIVRGICCLIPGRKYSRNIRVTRIVDTFLEHARVWYFGNGGKPKLFLGSPDWMRRNLYRRIEAVTPILDPDLKRELSDMLSIQLSDKRKACFVDDHLRNRWKSARPQKEKVRAQYTFYEYLKSGELRVES